MVLDGITRARGTRRSSQAAPTVPDVLLQLLGACLSTNIALGALDRATLLLDFGAALRRSELVALRLGDLEIIPNRGIRLLVRRSKTDQHGAGKDVPIWASPAEPLPCRRRPAGMANAPGSGARPGSSGQDRAQIGYEVFMEMVTRQL